MRGPLCFMAESYAFGGNSLFPAKIPKTLARFAQMTSLRHSESDLNPF